MEEDILKVYVEGKYRGERNRLTGFDVQFEVAAGERKIAVAWWKDNKETDRLKLVLDLVNEGDYDIRFNLVLKLKYKLFPVSGWHMKGSTIEMLREPD